MANSYANSYSQGLGTRGYSSGTGSSSSGDPDDEDARARRVKLLKGKERKGIFKQATEVD